MAGFREFQTGEVLTAANVNDYLGKQAVMKFADASARDTALGTAVGGSNALREGMIAWLDDTDEVIAYDGTSWATVGNAGIGTNVVSAETSTQVATTSASFVSTTLSASITPTSSSSKILILASIQGVADADAGFSSISVYRVIRNGSVAVGGDAKMVNQAAANGYDVGAQHSIVKLDSPASTSSVSYRVDVACQSTGGSRRSIVQGVGTSSIVLIEVAA